MSVTGLLPFTANAWYPQEVQLFLPDDTDIDRAFALQSLNEKSLYEALPEPGVLRAMEIVRLYENELEGVEDRIRKYQNGDERNYMPTFLHDRRNDLQKKIIEIRIALSKSQVIVQGDQVMGDKYDVKGQVAAVGKYAQASGNIFQQVWMQEEKNIDLGVLAAELSRLRSEMKQRITGPEQDEIIGHIAAAEKAAKAGDERTVFERLKDAGTWALDCAKEIGVNVASEVIKKSMGL
jgi:hypothetical protein